MDRNLTRINNPALKDIVKKLYEGKSAPEVFIDESTDPTITFEQIRELELLLKNEQPVIKLQPIKLDAQAGGGRPSQLNYDVPDSTAYVGLNYVILEHPNLNNAQTGWFNPPGTKGVPPIPPAGASVWAQHRTEFPNQIEKPPPPLPPSLALRLYMTLDQVAMSSNVHPIRVMPFETLSALGVATGLPPLTDDQKFLSFEMLTLDREDAVYRDLARLVHNKIVAGYAPFFNRTTTGKVDAGYAPDNIPKDTTNPKIMLVETYSLRSYLGDYGAGKTVKTFSLLPNEKTRISIKTWKTTEINFKQASSILDTWTKDSSDAFEKTITNENSNRQEIKQSSEWHAEAEISGGFHTLIWGIDAKISGGTKGSSNSAREVFAKNVSNATAKQVANASSKRNVEVNTSQEAKTVTGEENLIERQLENMNAGRVLNFIFRQLHQEYITYLHLTDVRLAFTNGLSGDRSHYREFGLNRIEEFLDAYIKRSVGGTSAKPHDEVRRLIVEELNGIIDYKGTSREFIDAVDFSSGVRSQSALEYLDETKRLEGTLLKLYLRVHNQPFYQNTDPKGTDFEEHLVDGIILRKNAYILPTDSLIVEALLGQAEALDKYSQDSRIGVIESQKEEISKMRLANSIIESEDQEKADTWAKIYPPPPPPPTPQPTSSIMGTNKSVRTKKNEL